MFHKKNKTGKKEFGLQTDGQDFRIMAAAIVVIEDRFYVVFGTSSGHVILLIVLFEGQNVRLQQLAIQQHSAAVLSMKRVCLDA